MNKLRTRALAAGVLALGFLVCLGWALGVESFKSVVPGLVTMKLATALSFVLCGIGCVFATKERWAYDSLAVGIIGTSAVAVLSIMLVLALNLHELEFQGDSNVQTVKPGEPSFGTMIGFVLVSFGMLSLPFNGTGRFATFRRVLGPIVSILGVVALVGYALGLPSMYYYWPDRSTGMAVHTSVGFVALGYVIAHLRRADIHGEKT